MLNEIRKQINDIDEEMIFLFKKRINVVKQILEYKKQNNLPILDENREIDLLKKNIKILNDSELEQYYKIFFNGVLNSSKKFQVDNL